MEIGVVIPSFTHNFPELPLTPLTEGRESRGCRQVVTHSKAPKEAPNLARKTDLKTNVIKQEGLGRGKCVLCNGGALRVPREEEVLREVAWEG